jgi:hypothetical protein
VVIHADVLIYAGHEGRPASCTFFPQHKCNLGAAGEREWTPVVADEATRILRAHGVKVIRLPADFAGTYDVKEAVFIHFDGASPPCTSRASIGYPPGAANAAAAGRWRALYSRYWPFGFMPDNFTDGLREYYAYKQMHATQGTLTIELGELSCASQHAWLGERLQLEGALLAYFLGKRIGFSSVPLPRISRPG